MKGDELPAIRTKSQHNLIKQGIARKGWNVPTLFIDVPMNFEDQILLDRQSWEPRKTTLKSVVTIYGDDCFVKPGANIHTGETVGLHMDGDEAVFKLEGSSHVVTEVTKKPFIMGDINKTIHTVTVETTRYFKEGFKVTNTQGMLFMIQ